MSARELPFMKPPLVASLLSTTKCILHSSLFEKGMVVTGEDSERFNIITGPPRLFPVTEVTVYRKKKILASLERIIHKQMRVYLLSEPHTKKKIW